ncbi:MAG: hypothetical protein ABSF00_07265 [Candidatus Bathyarchaeia archaeon]
MDSKKVRRIGAFAAILPALDHLVSPTLGMMFAPAFMHQEFGDGVVPVVTFFIALGLFQLAWIGIILKSINRSLLALGIFGFSVSIIIYFVSTQMWLPFGVPPQPLAPFAFLIKALEAIFILASLYILRTRANIRTSK